MSWTVDRNGTDYALISRDQWRHLYVAIKDPDYDEAIETLLRIKPRHWPNPDDMLNEVPE